MTTGAWLLVVLAALWIGVILGWFACCLMTAASDADDAHDRTHAAFQDAPHG